MRLIKPEYFIYFVLILFFIGGNVSQATELRRSTSVTLSECNSEQYASNLPKATAYINKIKDHIISSNSSVFVGDLAPENICFGVDLNPVGGRAWAEAVHRSARVDSSLIQRAQNDAQMAIVVAHELAHITMRHTLDANPINGSQRNVAQAAFTRIYQLLSQLSGAAKGAETMRINSELDTQRAIVNPLLESQLGVGASNNWEESEADIVGANFYLRAGFTSDEIAWRTQQISIANANNADAHGPPPNISAQARIVESNRICGVTQISRMSEPVRGIARYPSECWSTWRLLRHEPETNSVYRELMNDNLSLVNLSGAPTLAEVKAEIEAAPSNINPKEESNNVQPTTESPTSTVNNQIINRENGSTEDEEDDTENDESNSEDE